MAAGVSSDVGVGTFKVRVDDGHGNQVSSPGTPLTVTDNVPRVMSVHVGSSAWTSVISDHLATGGLGSTAGYLIPSGAAQSNPLPWANLNKVSITFTENVGVAHTDLRIIGVNAPASPAFTHFEYDFPSRTATWTLAGNLGNDKLLLVLNDRATDATNNAIDGEWTDNVSSLSGDGEAGGAFVFGVNVLPGDVDGDGSVTTTDVTQVRMLVPSNTSSSGFNLRADFDGNGSISTSDVTQARLKVGTTLPTGSPVPPVSQTAIAQSLPATTTLATAGSAGSSASTARSRAFETFGPPAPTSTTPFQKFIGPLLPRDLADSLARGLAIQATMARESSDSSAVATDMLLGGSTDWRVAAGLVRPSNRCEHAGKAIAK